MKPEAFLSRRVLAALAALLLAGCLETKTGSNGTGGQQPTIAPAVVSGTLSGAEPFVVGSATLDTGGAAVRRDEDANAGTAKLRLGMNVQARGTSTGALNTTPITVQEADTQSTARGFVRAVDVAAQRFTVATLAFTVDANTLYDGVGGIGALAVGDYVEVFGLTLADFRSTLATRVTRTPAPADGRTSISARFIPAASQNGFTIAGIAVPGAASTSLAPQGTNRVRVSGILDAAATTITGEQLVYLTDFAPAPQARVDVEGVALQVGGTGTFLLRTPAIDYTVSPALGPAPPAVATGSRVRVVGAATSPTAIAADFFETVSGPLTFRVTGVVSDFASLASLRVRGEPVDLTTAVIRGGTASEIANGRRLAIVGVAGPGAIRVSEATLQP